MAHSTISTPSSPFLSGNFAPVSQEHKIEISNIVGEIPVNLQGNFVRNGPNPQYPPLGQYHWFDGDGMVHEVTINQGKAEYRNRYVRTTGFLAEQESGKAIYTGLLEPNSDQGLKNVSNTALAWHQSKLLSLWEGGFPYHIALPSLETIGEETFGGKLNCPFTAHPKVDPMTGEMMFIGYNLVQPPFLQYGIVNNQGEIAQIVPIELPVGVMMHDFAITANYTIFFNLPYTFRPERIAQGKPAFAFEAETPSYFGILPRHGRPEDIRWFTANSCYIFHSLNAYEVGDEIILFACRMAKSNALGMADDPNISPEDNLPFLTQWRFHLSHNTVQETRYHQTPSEFPRINEQYLGRPTRYGYTASMAAQPLPLFDGVIKHDLETGKTWHYHYGEDRYGGEVVFAPNPQGQAEDDGWLITFVYDQSTAKSELVIIPAQNFPQAPVTRLLLPCRVPYGFHGIWISN